MGTTQLNQKWNLNKAQNRLGALVGDDTFSTLQPLSYRHKIAGLTQLLLYFYGKTFR